MSRSAPGDQDGDVAEQAELTSRADGLPAPVDDVVGGPHEGAPLPVAGESAQHPGQDIRVR